MKICVAPFAQPRIVSNFLIALVGTFVLLGAVMGCAHKANVPPVEQRLPFRVRIVDEQVRDGLLSVQVGITAPAQWDPDSVVVELATIKNGEKAQHTNLRLGDILSRPLGMRLLPGDKEVSIPLQIPIHDASDYQLSVKWGADALPYLVTAKALGAPSVSFVVTETLLQHTPCGSGTGVCPLRYVVKGELLNESEVVAEGVTLGLSLISRGGGTLEGEERVLALPHVKILPRQKSRITINVDRDLTPEAAQVLIPAVRVLSE